MTQRSIWKGALGFGMVNIPVKLYGATEDKRKDFSLTSMHSECGSQVKMPKFCPTCNKHFSAELGNLNELVKAYPLSEDKLLPLLEEELANLPLKSAKSITVEHFIAGGSEWLSDPRWFKDAYFLAPDDVGQKAFALFLKAMDELGVYGIAKIAMRGKEHLCVISPFNGLLMLETIHWADEIRDMHELIAPSVSFSEKEMELAKTLIQAMTSQVDPSAYEDEYRKALTELIEAKIEGKTITPVTVPQSTNADLVSSLLASLNIKNGV